MVGGCGVVIPPNVHLLRGFIDEGCCLRLMKCVLFVLPIFHFVVLGDLDCCFELVSFQA